MGGGTVNGPSGNAVDGGTHSAGLACARCYAKHLTKAMVGLSEYAEDRGRAFELASCIGNIACAEDHAEALGLRRERMALRRIRSEAFDMPDAVWPELRDMAVSAVETALSMPSTAAAVRTQAAGTSEF